MATEPMTTVSGVAAGADMTALAPRLLDMIGASWMSQAICVACELQLPELLAQRPCTASELAEHTGCASTALRRLLRGLTAMGLCDEDAIQQTFELTAMGRLLASGTPMNLRSWALWWGRHLWPVWQDLRGSIETGKSVRERRTGQRGYAHLERDAEAAEIFNASMAEISRYVATAALARYDFSWARKIVDVGGGYGEFLFQMLDAFPQIHGVIYDLPHAIDVARTQPRYSSYVSRCQLIAGDFFQSVPAGSDLYLMKAILHNWPDDRALAILQRCREAMLRSARLILIERVLPEQMSCTKQDRALARTDLNMLVGLGGRERTRNEMECLLTEANLTARDFVPLTPEYTLVECWSR